MAALRNEILGALYWSFPRALSRVELGDCCRIRFLTRDKVWFDDAVGEQLKVLLYAALIRPASKGYTLTEKGRQDRQQVARFNLNNNPPPEAA
jgi:hypothetical protein